MYLKKAYLSKCQQLQHINYSTNTNTNCKPWNNRYATGILFTIKLNKKVLLKWKLIMDYINSITVVMYLSKEYNTKTIITIAIIF